MITFSAPGKIHLLGEHTVVYGKPALLTAINKRITVSIAPLSERKQTMQLDSQLSLLQITLENVIKNKFHLKKIPNYSIAIKSELPIGSGLGSSAALSVAFTAGLLSYLKIDSDKIVINELAYEGEKIFHGKPAGADNTTVTYGGFIWYRKELEELKVFYSIPQKIHPKIEQFFLINSGKPLETTKDMVVKVGLLKSKNPAKVKKIFDDQEQLTKDLLIALINGEHQNLISIIRKGEHNLEAIGVVGKKSKNMIKEIETIGGGCKILGGGGFESGSGMLLAYHTDPKKLLSLIKKNNWDYMEITLGEEGLKREEESV